MSTFRPTRGGPRIAGVLTLAAEQTLGEIVDEVLLAYPDLRRAHVQIFRFGSLEGRRITELAADAGMTKQSMQELIDHFEHRGYLRRQPDPTDTRAKLVRLTARGQELEDLVVAASGRVHTRWAEGLGPRRFAELWNALQQMTGRQDPLPDTDVLHRNQEIG